MKSSQHQLRLITRAIHGEAEAFASLHQRYLGAAYRYFYFRSGNEDVAQQLTTRLFVRAWEALPTDAELSKLPFSVWLLRHAHHVIGEYRTLLAALDIPLQLPPLVAWSSSTRSKNLPRLNPRYLAVAIQHLNALEQQIIVLRFMLRLPHKDIALILGDTEEGVGLLQYRALLSLQKVLTRKSTGENPFALGPVTTASFCIDRVIADTFSIESSLENVAEPTLELKALLQCAAIVVRARQVPLEPDFESNARRRIVNELGKSIRPPVVPTPVDRLRWFIGSQLSTWLDSIFSGNDRFRRGSSDKTA